MHEIEPYYNWQKYYQAERDFRSPFFGREYGQEYVNDVYGYYIDPNWDEIGSSTLYCKILYTDYGAGYTIIELFGEWNDTLHNDVMYLKRMVVDKLSKSRITKYILIAENLLQFHGGETDYYEEWLEDVEDGWISLLNARDFILSEMQKYNLDSYINMGGTMQIEKWRTAKPDKLFAAVDILMKRRLGA